METNRPMIHILIADDHTLVRQGIRMLLETQPDIEIVGEAGDGMEAVRLALELHPDIVVMDIAMPQMDGLEAARQLKQYQPQTQVLVLTMHEGEEYFFRILSAGAAGYVPKRAAANDLIAAVRAVARGEVVLTPAIVKKLVAEYLAHAQGNEREGQPGAPALTPREHEVLTLIAEGYANREIADKLGVSLSTIQTHYAHLIEKLNLRNRTELVKFAMHHGLLDATA